MEKHHFKQAKIWLEGATIVAELSEYESEKYAVAVAMTIHAILKANDALTFKFLGITAKRHDNARLLFEDLIKKDIIRQEYAGHTQTIQDAITNKTKAEYRGAFFSKHDFEEMKRKAEKFLKMVEEIVK